MKGFIVSGRRAVALMSVLAAVTVTGTCVALLTAANVNRRLPIYCVENEKRQVALTFDAAWTADDVPDIIRILKQYNAPSTFFCVGTWAEKYPDAVKALEKAGHEIGNHSASHKHVNTLGAAAFEADTAQANDILASITGKAPTLYRGPYGEYTNTTVAAVENLGMYYIQWDCDSRDWKTEYTVADIVQSATKDVQPGSILLLHVGATHTVEALPLILEKLKKDGYEFVLVSDLIYKENYSIDHAGKQQANA